LAAALLFGRREFDHTDQGRISGMPQRIFKASSPELVQRFFKILTEQIPTGYEDEKGFHIGAKAGQNND
jgi:hypothetical protein